MKKEYQKPSMKVVPINTELHLLAGSGGRSVIVQGLNDEFYYDDTPGDGSDAW